MNKFLILFTSVTSDLIGNIDNSNKINLSYKVNGVKENGNGNLEFTNTALDIKGNDLTVRTKSDAETITIDNVEFKAK